MSKHAAGRLVAFCASAVIAAACSSIDPTAERAAQLAPAPESSESTQVALLTVSDMPAGWQSEDRPSGGPGYFHGSCSGFALRRDHPPLSERSFRKGSPNSGTTAMMALAQYRVDNTTLELIARRAENCNGELDNAMTAVMRLTGGGPSFSEVSLISLGLRPAVPMQTFRIYSAGSTVDGETMFSVVYVTLLPSPPNGGTVIEFWTVSQGSEQQYLDAYVEVVRSALPE